MGTMLYTSYYSVSPKLNVKGPFITMTPETVMYITREH